MRDTSSGHEDNVHLHCCSRRLLILVRSYELVPRHSESLHGRRLNENRTPPILAASGLVPDPSTSVWRSSATSSWRKNLRSDECSASDDLGLEFANNRDDREVA